MNDLWIVWRQNCRSFFGIYPLMRNGTLGTFQNMFKLTIKTQVQYHFCNPICNSEHILHTSLVFMLLTFNIYLWTGMQQLLFGNCKSQFGSFQMLIAARRFALDKTEKYFHWSDPDPVPVVEKCSLKQLLLKIKRSHWQIFS